MIVPGDPAPDFELRGTDGDDFDTYRLGDLAERGQTVVLSFYVFDFHPACTAVWCSLRDADWLTFMDDVTVLGVSTDRVFSHRRFAAETDLAFPLLSDSDGAVSDDYGVLYDEFAGHRRVSKRATFVVDPDLTVRYAWSTDDPTDQPDLSAVQQAILDLPATAASSPVDAREREPFVHDASTRR